MEIRYAKPELVNIVTRINNLQLSIPIGRKLGDEIIKAGMPADALAVMGDVSALPYRAGGEGDPGLESRDALVSARRMTELGAIFRENYRRAAELALAGGDTLQVFSIVLARLYVLRNQLLHGGATWNGAVNRAQVRDCANLLGKLVPIVIEIMMDHPKHDWGAATYPVVKDSA